MSSPRLIMTRRQPSIILPIEAQAVSPQADEADIRAHLVPPLPARWGRHRWAWGAALLLHALVIAAMLLIRFKPLPMALQSPPGIDVQFEGSSNQSATTSPTQTQSGPPQQAQDMAMPPPPPPPPPAVQEAMQDEVRMPDIPLSALSSPLPPPRPRTRPHETHAHATRPSRGRQQKYVFLNGMDYGNGRTAAQPAPMLPHGLNLSPPMSNAQAATASDFSVKGNAGAGWDAALSKWVQEHAYYPQAAIAQNQQGTAIVEFTVDRQGHVSGIRLLSSSGSPFLDQAWFQLFADNTLPPFPPGAKSDHVVVRYTVHYQLLP